ncbi:hypothetical protein SAMN02927914_05857 [Mesorhizobium qingshengii]|uniref:Uncharacterized protein n=1 Tax=Mesorhizobium qingshengii TaxID=1165689 RepID=A0A1G5ZS03_9HYPH|nr:hypothetical protein SAMN02927914_05857 [Mesorhizobium qingshengii]
MQHFKSSGYCLYSVAIDCLNACESPRFTLLTIDKCVSAEPIASVVNINQNEATVEALVPP